MKRSIQKARFPPAPALPKHPARSLPRSSARKTVAESESFIYTRQMGKAPSPAAIFWGIHSGFLSRPTRLPPYGFLKMALAGASICWKSRWNDLLWQKFGRFSPRKARRLDKNWPAGSGKASPAGRALSTLFHFPKTRIIPQAKFAQCFCAKVQIVRIGQKAIRRHETNGSVMRRQVLQSLIDEHIIF